MFCHDRNNYAQQMIFRPKHTTHHETMKYVMVHYQIIAFLLQFECIFNGFNKIDSFVTTLFCLYECTVYDVTSKEVAANTPLQFIINLINLCFNLFSPKFCVDKFFTLLNRPFLTPSLLSHLNQWNDKNFSSFITPLKGLTLMVVLLII